jgi:enoyl-CoA hydratase/carnithine racemase
VAVLRGAGPAFCAGHDLAELVGRDVAFYRHVFQVCTTMMNTLQQIPQPVIAQVHGMATAAGCQLVATCDLAVASTEARFATPGVRIGLFCSTPMVAVSRNLPRKKAMEMLLTGEPLSAEEALRYGLVNRVVPPDRLEEETRQLALRVASASPPVVGMGKQAFYRQLDLSQDQAYAYAQEVMSLNALHPGRPRGDLRLPGQADADLAGLVGRVGHLPEPSSRAGRDGVPSNPPCENACGRQQP